MPRYVRYAVYYAPAATAPLARFAAGWLGHDPAGGAVEPIRRAGALGREAIDRITAEPRRYGFHATLKAPFALAAGANADMLAREVSRIAAGAPPVAAGPLGLTEIGPFLALCPSGDTGPLDALASRLVRDLDAMRAPLGDDERARRRADRLTTRQRRYLEDWGYPYVFEDFRFHLTLTGPLGEAERALARAALAPMVEPSTRDPFTVDDICLFGDPGGGRPFEIVSRHRLSGGSRMANASGT